MTVFDFDRAILRRPADSVVAGLRAYGGPSPALDGVEREHAAYAKALAAAGVAIDMLPALDAFPDSIFVEDPALVFADGAILLRPGAPSRLGEAAELRPALERHFGDGVQTLEEGHADGGDILVLPGEVLIGLSSRTDATGAGALVRALARLGRAARIVSPPADALHLKSAAALLDEETILCTRSCAGAGLFAGMRLLLVPAGEEPAANALRVNGTVFAGSRFPRTIAAIERHGLAVVPLDTGEIGKIDAGLSCMSLRWSSAGAAEGMPADLASPGSRSTP